MMQGRSSGRVEGGTWAAGMSSLTRPLEIFWRNEREREGG